VVRGHPHCNAPTGTSFPAWCLKKSADCHNLCSGQPDIIAAKPGGVAASWRYRCTDKQRPAPFLAVYKVPDMGFLQSSEFKSIPMVHPSLPDNGPIHRFAEFDARFLGHVESWSSEQAESGSAYFPKSSASILATLTWDRANGTPRFRGN
jgi:hypothetical protein